MTEGIRYRLANQGDASGIAALHAANWRRAYRGNFRDEYLDGDISSERQAVWNARLGNPPTNQYVCVAVEDSRVVGFVCVFGSHDRQWGSFIDNLHVDANMQGRGIGTALMHHAGAWLASQFPKERAHLPVWELNPARALYEHLGGRNTGIVEAENPGGGVGRYFRYVWDQPHQLVAYQPVAADGMDKVPSHVGQCPAAEPGR
jgi:GNAT superfamily N-acetyltransferase